jgi:hypothetical protein
MLFSPPPPLSVQPVSSSLKDDSTSSSPPSPPPPPTPYTPSVSNASSTEIRPRAVSASHTAALLINGPPDNRLLSISQSRVSQLPDQDWFHSPSSPPSSARPSIQHLTPTSAKTLDTKTSDARRRESCPAQRNNKRRDSRFHFPTIIKSTIRDALSTSTPPSDLDVYTNNVSRISRTSVSRCARPSSIFLPVANPVAAAALMEDDELVMDEEELAKSITPSPMGTPKGSARSHRTPTECSTSTGPPNSYNSKAILNVGGVRHEGNV